VVNRQIIYFSKSTGPQNRNRIWFTSLSSIARIIDQAFFGKSQQGNPPAVREYVFFSSWCPLID